MADQLRWWKLWDSAIDDEKVAALSLEDFARWCLLGLVTSISGTAGVLRLKISQQTTRHTDGTAPAHRRHTAGTARLLRNVWKFPTGSGVQLLRILKRLPSIRVDIDGDDVTITWPNWYKYQMETSKDRMERLRGNRGPRAGPRVQHTEPGDSAQQQHTAPSDPAASLARPLPPYIPPTAKTAQQARCAASPPRRYLAGYRFPDDFRGSPSRPLDPEAVVLIDPDRHCTDVPPFSNLHPAHVHHRDCRMPRRA